jgi:hypothetical protein
MVFSKILSLKAGSRKGENSSSTKPSSLSISVSRSDELHCTDRTLKTKKCSPMHVAPAYGGLVKGSTTLDFMYVNFPCISAR